jgi:deleted-in-malignant-brain-tumors protein 1
VGRATENCGVYEFDGDKYYDIAVDFFTTAAEFALKVEYSGPDTNEKKEILNSWEASAYPPPPRPSQWAMRTWSSGHTLYAIEQREGLNLVGTGFLPWPTIQSREYLDAVVAKTPTSNYVYEFWGTLEVTERGEHQMCTEGTDGSRLFLDGELITWNDVPGGREACHAVDLEIGRYVVKVDGWQRGERARMFVSYKGPNTRYTQQLIYSEGVPKIPAPPPRSRLSMRVYYAYYNLYSVPPYEGYLQYAGRSPGVLLPIFGSLTDFRAAGLRGDVDSDFAYILYGRLGIQRGGTYKFCVSSIDGTLFAMDGVLLIENDGVHDYQQVCTETLLRSGDHDWVLRGFAGTSRIAMRLEYEGLDTHNSLVPVISNSDQAPAAVARPGSTLSWGANGAGSSVRSSGGIVDRQLLSDAGRYLVNVNWDGNMQIIEMQSFAPVNPIRIDTCRQDGVCLLEVLRGGAWGTVCDDSFSNEDATVVCKQLGCADATGRGATATTYGGPYANQPERASRMPIWMDDVQCSADARGLSMCQHRGWGLHDCAHSEDVGVSCQRCPTSGGGMGSNPLWPLGRTIWETGTAGRGTGPFTLVQQQDGNVVLYDAGRSVVWMIGASGWGSASFTITDYGNVVTSYGNGNTWSAGVVGSSVWYHVLCPAGDNGIARLVGCSSRACRLEVQYHRQWGTVCDDGFSNADAAVVCRSLGFPTVNAVAVQAYGGGTDPIWMDDVQCYGDELEITHCPKVGWGEHNCVHQEDVGVCCDGGSTTQFTRSTNPVELNCPGGDNGIVRLVSCTPEACRVEVNHGGSFGTVCDDGFTQVNAQVVCRSLGYTPQGSVQVQAFGGGRGLIWMDDVQCSGSEPELTWCKHSGWAMHNCVHEEDVGVCCQGRSTINYVPSMDPPEPPLDPIRLEACRGDGVGGDGRVCLCVCGGGGGVGTHTHTHTHVGVCRVEIQHSGGGCVCVHTHAHTHTHTHT